MQPDLKTRLLPHQRKLGTGAVGVLVLFCAGHLGSSLYQDIATDRFVPTQINHLTSSATRQTTAVSLNTLTNAHFFGMDQPLDSPSPVQQVDVPETRMSLALHGVIGSSIVEEGRALIAEKGKNAKYYGVDDTLPGGATLHRIAINQVILSRNGMLETLSFPKPQSQPGSPAFAALDPDTGTSAAADPSPQFQQLHESQVADYAEDESSHSESQSEGSPQTSMSIKERLKQLRESRDL